MKVIIRGNGLEGEFVIYNVKYIVNIFYFIVYDGEIEIRGEVIIVKEDFDVLNKECLDVNEFLFVNFRNVVLGSLR